MGAGLLSQDQPGSESHANEHHQHNAKHTEKREHVEHLCLEKRAGPRPGLESIADHSIVAGNASESPSRPGGIRAYRRKSSSGTVSHAVRPTSLRVRRWPTVCHGVTSASSGMISRI